MKIVLVALHLQKNVTFFFFAKLLPQMPLGVEWLPGVAASKQSSVGKCVGSFALMASVGMCAPGRRTERSVGGVTLSFTRIFNRSTQRVDVCQMRGYLT